jgi:hypothetical protein
LPIGKLSCSAKACSKLLGKSSKLIAVLSRQADYVSDKLARLADLSRAAESSKLIAVLSRQALPISLLDLQT